MKNISIKCLCYVLVLAAMITTISVMNSDLSALAMEPFSYENETDEEIFEIISDNPGDFDITVVGNLRLDNNCFSIERNNSNDLLEYEDVMSTDTASSEVELKKEYAYLDNIKYTDKVVPENIKKKVNKDEVKSYIISEEKVPDFFDDENLDIIDDLLNNGYSIYYQASNDIEADRALHKMGLIQKKH